MKIPLCLIRPSLPLSIPSASLIQTIKISGVQATQNHQLIEKIKVKYKHGKRIHKLTDNTISLASVVQHEVENYSGPSIKARTFALSDPEKHTYAVMIVPDFPRKFDASIMVLARLDNGKVVIEEDTTDHPLWRELVRAGIPREQIVLAYAGEKLSEGNT